MSIFSFGEYKEGLPYKVLDERVMRASSGIMFLVGLIASINGFVLDKYAIIPYTVGFLVLNFMIGLFINPKFSPTILLASKIVKNQSAQPIGAVQKKFAWSLGLVLSSTIFVLSLYLQNDKSYFEPVCFLCIICMILMYLETAFGICAGCKLYAYAIRLKIIPKPKEKPNCMGDSCAIEN